MSIVFDADDDREDVFGSNDSDAESLYSYMDSNDGLSGVFPVFEWGAMVAGRDPHESQRSTRRAASTAGGTAGGSRATARGLSQAPSSLAGTIAQELDNARRRNVLLPPLRPLVVPSGMTVGTYGDTVTEQDIDTVIEEDLTVEEVIAPASALRFTASLALPAQGGSAADALATDRSCASTLSMTTNSVATISYELDLIGLQGVAASDYISTRRRLDAAEAQTLPRMRFSAPEMHSCSICLENFLDGVLVTKLNCDHAFHVDCLTTWVQQCAECPNCRAEIKL